MNVSVSVSIYIHTCNDVSNQQDATTLSFINLFKSALHVSGDKFAHPQEHFLTVYTAFGAPTLLPTGATGRQQCRCIVPKAVCTFKTCDEPLDLGNGEFCTMLDRKPTCRVYVCLQLKI